MPEYLCTYLYLIMTSLSGSSNHCLHFRNKKTKKEVMKLLSPPPPKKMMVIRKSALMSAKTFIKSSLTSCNPRPLLGWERPIRGGASYGEGPREVGRPDPIPRSGLFAALVTSHSGVLVTGFPYIYYMELPTDYQ